MVDSRRVQTLKGGENGVGPVVYIMARDQRVNDNWALLHAQELALELGRPLLVILPLAIDYPNAPKRQISFMNRGLAELGNALQDLSVPLLVARKATADDLASLVSVLKAGAVVTDFNPLGQSRAWKKKLAERITAPIHEVDAHNIVPCWEASDKQEYAAYTFRRRINKLLPEYLSDIPPMVCHPFRSDSIHSDSLWKAAPEAVAEKTPTAGLLPQESGERAARQQLDQFLVDRLHGYRDRRNNPVVRGQSELSPYLHFGQISAQRVALEAERYDSDLPSQEAFLEELIVRRELSDNFCYYNAEYDNFVGFPAWAQETLNQHRLDPRPFLYPQLSLEEARTHDSLWNAAQTELAVTGRMSGYLRMYWAKKILEWSPTPEAALAVAITLNDSYALDGNDPNGYVGIAWSIGGVHDRAWSEREIYGKIRYMNYNGCKRKFGVDDYVAQVAALAKGKAA